MQTRVLLPGLWIDLGTNILKQIKMRITNLKQCCPASMLGIFSVTKRKQPATVIRNTLRRAKTEQESEELKKGPMGGLREMGAGRAASHRD